MMSQNFGLQGGQEMQIKNEQTGMILPNGSVAMNTVEPPQNFMASQILQHQQQHFMFHQHQQQRNANFSLNNSNNLRSPTFMHQVQQQQPSQQNMSMSAGPPVGNVGFLPLTNGFNLQHFVQHQQHQGQVQQHHRVSMVNTYDTTSSLKRTYPYGVNMTNDIKRSTPDNLVYCENTTVALSQNHTFHLPNKVENVMGNISPSTTSAMQNDSLFIRKKSIVCLEDDRTSPVSAASSESTSGLSSSPVSSQLPPLCTIIPNANQSSTTISEVISSSGCSCGSNETSVNCCYCSTTSNHSLNSTAQNSPDSSLTLMPLSPKREPRLLFTTIPPHIGVMNYLETFSLVPGRLSLLTGVKKYRISVGEVHRRISQPECLNVSIIGGIMRKAKSRSGGQALRKALCDKGINLQSGRRKTMANTLFTSFVEEEALQLASDFNDLCQAHFPSNAMANFLLANQQINSIQDADNQRIFVSYFNNFLNNALTFLRSDSTPLTDQLPAPQLHLDMQSQQAMSNFTLLTHGFGNLATQAVIKTLQHCLNECSLILNAKFPSNFPQMSSPPPTMSDQSMTKFPVIEVSKQ